MIKCADCELTIEKPSGWYAELLPEGKKMRCPSCGIKEESKRWKERHGYKVKPDSFEEISEQECIQYAKDLREAGLSPWRYKKEI